MLIPRVMKGLEKSMTFSRSAVMVNAATARSAFCWRGSRVGEWGWARETDGQLGRNALRVQLRGTIRSQKRGGQKETRVCTGPRGAPCARN